MNANLDLERRLADYYAGEAPQRAPERVLEGVLAQTDTTTQRHAVFRLPWRFPIMNSYAKTAIAAVAVIAIGAVGFAVLRPGPSPAGVGDPSSPGTAVESPTPSAAAAAPIPGTAANFVRPFDYLLPSDPDFEGVHDTERSFGISVPEWAEAGHLGGLIIQPVGGARSDPCDAASAASVPLEPGLDAVFDYLATIPQLTITELPDTTVDGRRARQARVTAGPGTTACPDLWVWPEDTEPFISETDLRLIAVDVDGEHLVVTIYGESGNPEWPGLADEFVSSIRFVSLTSPSP